MPSRHVRKVNLTESYYHAYARGASKQKIFLDARDYTFFVSLFRRYLSDKSFMSKIGGAYPCYRGKVELLAFCLMRNHVHLLLYQVEQDGMLRLMQSIMTSYTRYFNLKYKRSGPLFESCYKASLIDQEAYLLHISRYIHLNPRRWRTHRYSSLKYYLLEPPPVWLTPDRITGLFTDQNEYEQFVDDYGESMRVLDDIKHQLADH